jgi:EAL domain-containing protein (putative c-di-GMP-specific phosphodiesterase class I)/CheY-like chemotaxis protein
MTDTSSETARPTFGRRKMTPRACVADAKAHVRIFLSETLEDLGFIAQECEGAADLDAVFERAPPDLLVLGLSGNGANAHSMLQVLARHQFDGRVLPVAPRDSVLATAVRQAGHELGIAVLPTLPTPFGADTLRDSLAMLLPAAPAPSPPVDVAEALKAGWLELWYQHKVDIRTLHPRGAEALIRLRHPAWGVVPPAAFLPDETDPHFRQLSEFVIRRAFDDWRHFAARHGPVDISVNLPVAFLKIPDAIHDMRLHMPTHPGFGGLLIELSCADVIQNLDFVADAARRMRFHNIAISLDDVGAEWPALMALQGFPFAELKVDRQFVTGAADDRLKQTVCRGIADFAGSVGARTVGVGVETRADFVAAHQAGLDLVQGFLFGKPMAAGKFARAALARPIMLPDEQRPTAIS